MHDLYPSLTEVSKASFEQPVEYPDSVMSILFELRPPTGAPYARDPPERFGGEGGDVELSLHLSPIMDF